MKHYGDMGVKGFKVDFFDRDDQKAINSVYEIAECAAKHHLCSTCMVCVLSVYSVLILTLSTLRV